MLFQHEPLRHGSDQIRLLRLQPLKKTKSLKEDFSKRLGQDTDTIIPECSIFIANLFNYQEPKHVFNALSYTWGEPNPKRAILLNGQRFEVGLNLWQFLCVAMRDPGICRNFLWIDQISIDQNSTEERNHQVEMMGIIYARALNVFIWLGPATKSSDSAMKELSGGSTLRKIGLPYNHARLLDDPTFVSMLQDLLTRPYWNRLWIIQEVLLAKSPVILCGRRKVLWERFALVVQRLYSKTKESPALRLVRLRNENPEAESWFSLRTLIADFRHCKCADPRDKVFGLLALVPHEERIEVDYDIPLQALVLKTAAKIVPRDARSTKSYKLGTMLMESFIPPGMGMWERKIAEQYPLGEVELFPLFECYRKTESSDIRHMCKEVLLCLKHRANIQLWWDTSGPHEPRRYPWEYTSIEKRKKKIMESMIMRRSSSSSGISTWHLFVNDPAQSRSLGFVRRQADGNVSWVPRVWNDSNHFKPWEARPWGNNLLEDKSKDLPIRESMAWEYCTYLLYAILGKIKDLCSFTRHFMVDFGFPLLRVLFQACWLVIKNFHIMWKGDCKDDGVRRRLVTSRDNVDIVHSSRRENVEI